MSCKYCNKAIVCGCQRATANDGSVVHKSCLTDYQKTLSNVHTKSDSLTEKLNTANLNITKR
jgi:hypothetical protein